ncbi:hypothetical protein LMG33818_002325 [Halomonadaceae bacterium LMG 33818]|uniref:hypothetical protein n=1 Tax=Cernens ardua TaxID=3402176 RepID=UPI003EDC9D9E
MEKGVIVQGERKNQVHFAVIITVFMVLLYISSTLCTAAPFALTRHPPKWSLHVGALCPFLALILLNPFTRDPTATSVPIIVMLAIGIFSFSRAEKRLAKEDWVIEND